MYRPTRPPLSPTDPQFQLPPSSPRRDVIPSVQRRVAELFRSGRGARLLRNAHLDAAALIAAPSASSASSSSAAANLRNASSADASASTSSSASASASASAASSSASGGAQQPQPQPAHAVIDTYLRRAHVLQSLEADMLVRAVVFQKTERSVELQLIEAYRVVFDGDGGSGGNGTGTGSSGGSGSGGREELALCALDDLDVRGHCHADELDGLSIDSLR